MALKYIDSEGNEHNKVEEAIQRLKMFEPEDGYFLAFSGGKDSQCIYHLARQAGVKFDAHYSVTSVDPPELIYFIREHYPDVHMDIPRDKDGKRISMWSLIVKNGVPPTQIMRYCCKYVKEPNGKGRIVVTGVRWAESTRRKKNQGVARILNKPVKTKKLADEYGAEYSQNKYGGIILNDDNDSSRRLVEHCYRTQKTTVNPIVDWLEEDVWEYLNEVVKVPHCRLYDEGMKRIGCIGCPFAGRKNREAQFKRWPKYEELYLKAFDRMLAQNKNKKTWKNAQEVFDRWLSV